MAPLNRTAGYPYRQIEDAIRKIMAEHVGVMRTADGIRAGLQKLDMLARHIDEMKADTLHELMRSHETRSLLQVGRMMGKAALFRTESRNKPYHHRLDFPETDDQGWCGLVVLEKKGEDVASSFEPISYGSV